MNKHFNNFKGWYIGGLVLVLLFMVFSMYMGYSNQEVALRQQTKAQQKNLEVVFDNTWKIIQQVAQVSDQYRDAFMKIYPKLMEGRYGARGKGTLLSFITESNPNFDTSLYQKVANAIEGQRNNFTNEQSRLIDLKREHDTLRQTQPASWFIGNRPEILIVVVTSEKTDTAFKSGKDNDIEVFKK